MANNRENYFEPLAVHKETSKMLGQSKIKRIEYLKDTMLCYTKDTIYALKSGERKWKKIFQSSELCRDDGTINPKASGLQRVRKRLLK
jgi:hypothetical protein